VKELAMIPFRHC